MIVTGRPYRINTDFRYALKYNRMILSGEGVTEREILDLWFPEECPESFRDAHEAVKQFYRCGMEPSGKDFEGHMPYGFDADSGALVAAFQREYHIDLTRDDLHWWRFSALLNGLTSHSFSERVQYRVCNLQEIKSKDLRRRYAKLKRSYALDQHGRKVREPQTVEEYEAMLLQQARGGG